MYWECQACGYVIDFDKGDEAYGIDPSPDEEVLSGDWKCPVCGVGPEFFEKTSNETVVNDD